MMVPTACGNVIRCSALCSSEWAAFTSVSLSISRSSETPL